MGMPHDVAAPTRAQRLEILLRDHPRIPDEHTATQAPVLEVGLDFRDRGHIHRVARKHPVAHRKPIPSDRAPHHDLRGVVSTILRLATLPWGAIGLCSRADTAPYLIALTAAFIFLIDLEVNRGGVIENELHIEIEQLGEAKVECLFNRLLARLQKVHRPIEVVQLEPLSARNAHLLPKPLLVAVEL
jgi:hypothetical protein